jgi:hypothetical protein
MRERVHLCGGAFDAGPLPGGGFEVTAALPLPVPPAGAPTWDDSAAAGSGADPVRATGAAFAPGAVSAGDSDFTAGGISTPGAGGAGRSAGLAAAVSHGGRADGAGDGSGE